MGNMASNNAPFPTRRATATNDAMAALPNFSAQSAIADKMVLIGIEEAKDIVPGGSRRLSFRGKLMPYVEISFSSTVYQTSVFGEQSPQPVWKEVFGFYTNWPTSATATITLLDSSTDQTIGQAKLSFPSDFSNGEILDTWLDIFPVNSSAQSSQNPSGSVRVRAHLCDSADESKIGAPRKSMCHHTTTTQPLSSLFTLVEILGRGHCSEVHLAAPAKNPRQMLAVKIYSAANLKTNRESVANEVAVMTALDHRNVVVLREVITTKDGVCLVTDFVPGGSLLTRMEKGKLPEQVARHITKQLVGVLCFIHEKKIIHRNLKPENVLFTSFDNDGDIVLCDFATATFFDPRHSTPLTETFGTPAYFSPEITQRKPYDQSTDLWNLGVLVFTMLCGYHPFSEAQSDDDLYDLITTGAYHLDESDWENISTEARDFVAGLLRVNPLERMTAGVAQQHPWLAQETV